MLISRNWPSYISQAAAARTNKLIWRRLGVAIATALLALAITAGIISLVTAGQGLGSKTVLIPSSYTEPASPEQDKSAHTPQKPTEGANTAATADDKTTDPKDSSEVDSPTTADPSVHPSENNGDSNANGSLDATNDKTNKTSPDEDKQSPDDSGSGISSTETDTNKNTTDDDQTNTSDIPN